MRNALLKVTLGGLVLLGIIAIVEVIVLLMASPEILTAGFFIVGCAGAAYVIGDGIVTELEYRNRDDD